MSLISLRHSRQSRAVGPCGRAITAASRLGAGPEVGEQAAQLHYKQPTVLAFCISLYRFVDSKGHAMHMLCTSMHIYAYAMHIYAHRCTSMHIHQLEMSKALCSSFLYLSGGFSLNSRPAPPTQQMLDKFISVSNMWNTFSVGLEEAVRQTTIPEARCIYKKWIEMGTSWTWRTADTWSWWFDVFTIVSRNENSSCFDIV